ncbi:MAG: copper resistance protein CopC [Actinomycetota bacterium]
MTGTGLPVRRHATAILIAAFIVLLSGASPAWAHSGLERSDPPNSGMVAVGRSALTLWFTEAISPSASTFDLHTSDGVKVAVKVTVSGAGGGGFVQIRTEPLARATYVLDWRVLSLEDGHPLGGQVLFGVGMRPAALAAAAGGGLPEVPGLFLRWFDLSAIMLTIGALAVSGRVLASMGEGGIGPRRRARRIAAVAASVAVISGAITPFVRTRGGGSSVEVWLDATWSTLIGTPWGQLWLAREVALVIAAGALWRWAVRRDGSGRWLRLAAVALAVMVCLGAWAGHASALPNRSWWAAVASASHLVAAGVWAGGLVVLAIALIPAMRRNPDTRGPILASAWRAFSPLAAAATVVLLASGLYESGRHIPDLGAITSTVYGAAVTAKTVLMVVALALAGINTMLVNPRLAARVGRILGRRSGWAPLPLARFGKVVAAEVLVLVVAAGAAALLTSVPTAREVATTTRASTLHTANVDGLMVTFEEVPAGPDQSRLIVRTRPTVKLAPTPVSGVELLLVSPRGTTTKVSLAPIEAGRFEAETAKPTPGAWKASLALQRDKMPVAVTQVGWNVAAERPEGARPLETVTTTLASLLLLALAGAVGFSRRRNGPPSLSTTVVRQKAGSRP